MILLTDEELLGVPTPDTPRNLGGSCDVRLMRMNRERAVAKEQLKQTLISVGKESKRMDGTIYLVPDYVEYRKALKEVGLE